VLDTLLYKSNSRKERKLAKQGKGNPASEPISISSFAPFAPYMDVGNADLVWNTDRPNFAREFLLSSKLAVVRFQRIGTAAFGAPFFSTSLRAR
jgi:hypothetical protein